MPGFSAQFAALRAMLANPQIIKVRPSLLWFLIRYLRTFPLKYVDGQVFIHSHLPPLNSRAYTRFIDEHLIGGSEGPSHAQVGVTGACPQRCAYCYNRQRKGTPLKTDEVRRVVRELRELGVIWLGLTGGEPLLNPDLADIIVEAKTDCAVKLFTTGCTLTSSRAEELHSAGLTSVSVSLDHWEETRHDQGRGYPGAFREALRAIEIFRATGIHTGVSAVLTRAMLRDGSRETFLAFLAGLGIQEAWLSEVKPTLPPFRNEDTVITEAEREEFSAMQDRFNRTGGMTLNYLGHFEGAEHFGCNAGNKMIYIDAFGEVSPCVFIPASFGNVREHPLREIYREMRSRFPGEGSCFINRNYPVIERFSGGGMPLRGEKTLEMMGEVSFSPPSEFMRLFQDKKNLFCVFRAFRG